MSNYEKDKKFYWLQLKEDFFDEDSINWLEEQKNGPEYALFYLKLCLKSLKTNGVLIRKVGNLIIPYDNQKLAELTRTNIDTVIIAMELLKNIGLIEILSSGEIYLTQIENLIGQKSIGAFKKEQQRMLKNSKNAEIPKLESCGGQKGDKRETKGGQKVDICPPDIELDIEPDIDIELDIEKEKEEVVVAVVDKDKAKTENQKIEKNDFLATTTTTTTNSSNIDKDSEKLLEYYNADLSVEDPNNIRDTFQKALKHFSYDVVKYAIQIAKDNNVKKMSYIKSILEAWLDKGINSLEEAQSEHKYKGE